MSTNEQHLAGRSDGVALIAAERRRQVEGEGWSAEHDDGHDSGEMAIAAAMYAVLGTDATVDSPHTAPSCWIKPGDRIRELSKAGALIAAEIDRLQRATKLSGVSALSQEPGEC